MTDPRYGSRPAGGSSSRNSSVSATIVGDDDASTMAAAVFSGGGGRSSSVYTFDTMYTTSAETASDDDHNYLACEFRDLLGCAWTFGAREVDGWVAHVASHLGGRFPAKSLCWFCNDVVFDTGDSSSSSDNKKRQARFEERLRHVAAHQARDGCAYAHMRPDFYLVRHLREHAIIDADTYARCMRYTELPDELRRMRLAGADKPASSPRASSAPKRGDRGGGLVFDQAREDRLRRKEEREGKKKKIKK
ncbi:hypothetical protein RB601_000249 [Gaeumannomyces tritici]